MEETPMEETFAHHVRAILTPDRYAAWCAQKDDRHPMLFAYSPMLFAYCMGFEIKTNGTQITLRSLTMGQEYTMEITALSRMVDARGVEKALRG